MQIKFYLDEDVSVALAKALENRGVDALTTRQAGNLGTSDVKQLEFASEQNRVIFTHNVRDFAVIHDEYVKNDRSHSGIIVSNQLPIGTMLKRVLKLRSSLNADKMKNRFEFLSNWK